MHICGAGKAFWIYFIAEVIRSSMFLLFTFVCLAFLKFSIYSAWYSWGFLSLWFYLYTSTIILFPSYSRHFKCTYIMKNEVYYFTWMEIPPANSALYRIWEDSVVFILSENAVRIQIMSYRPIIAQSTCSYFVTGEFGSCQSFQLSAYFWRINYSVFSNAIFKSTHNSVF